MSEKLTLNCHEYFACFCTHACSFHASQHGVESRTRKQLNNQTGESEGILLEKKHETKELIVIVADC